MIAPLKKSPRVTTRAKSTGLTNRLDFETAVDRISYIEVELRQLSAERDAAVQRAQATHAEAIAELEEEKKAKLALCEKFADENRDALLPGKAKSAETPFARYGFRTGNPTLKPLSKWKWDDVLEAIKAAKFPAFVRVKEEVNKEAMLEHAKNNPETSPAFLSSLGCRVAQGETFYVEAKVDGEKGGAS